jgi:hypothetical protein
LSGRAAPEAGSPRSRAEARGAAGAGAATGACAGAGLGWVGAGNGAGVGSTGVGEGRAGVGAGVGAGVDVAGVARETRVGDMIVPLAETPPRRPTANCWIIAGDSVAGGRATEAEGAAVSGCVVSFDEESVDEVLVAAGAGEVSGAGTGSGKLADRTDVLQVRGSWLWPAGRVGDGDGDGDGAGAEAEAGDGVADEACEEAKGSDSPTTLAVVSSDES